MAKVIRGSEVPYYEAPEAQFRRFAKFLVSGGAVPEVPVTFGHFVYPAGARSHAHTHPFSTEIYYCVKGEMEAVVAGVTHKLSTGDLVIIPPGSHHYAANPGGTEAQFIAVHSPPVNDYEEFQTTWIERSSKLSSL